MSVLFWEDNFSREPEQYKVIYAPSNDQYSDYTEADR